MGLTSFVGRAGELDRLREVLAGERLVTVLGPAGAGKTRLVTELMTSHDGVFVELADATDPVSVRARLAAALEVPLVGQGEGQLDAVIAARGPILIVLDNAEHVAEHVAAMLAGWLQNSEARFLITSRLRLGVAGEQLFDLQALDTASAARLFIDRARAVRPALELGDDERAVLERLVERLDRLPLAIELAAARVRVLTVAQLDEQLSRRLDVLTGKNRSMRSALDASWELLDPALREALLACAVFRGGFDLEAAEAVIPGDVAALDAVQTLCEHSLLEVTTRQQRSRYRLYESVREYALEKASIDLARRRHAAHYVDIARRRPTDLGRELDNARAAHEHCLQHDPGGAVAIAVALDPILKRRGPMSLRLELIERALAAANELPADLHGDGLLTRAEALLELGQVEGARRDRERALELARGAGDELRVGRASAALGRLAWHRGELDAAADWYTRALEILDRLGGADDRALTRATLANVYTVRGEMDAARASYEQAAALLRAHDGAADRLGLVLGNLANMEANLDELEAAERHLDEAIGALRQSGERYLEGTFLLHRAQITMSRGRHDRARAQCDEALALQRRVGNRRWEGVTHSLLGELDEIAGDDEAARRNYERAIAMLASFGHPMIEGIVLCKLARLEAGAGRVGVARAHLHRAAEKLSSAGPLAALAEVCRAHVLLAEGDVGGAAAVASSAEDAAVSSSEVRWALARLRAALPVSTAALIIGDQGRWFQRADGPRVDLSRRRALHLILDGLARRHGSAAPMSLQDLLAQGWPGESVLPEAGQSRVYTAIATLRRMGLRSFLLRRDDGYLLDPSVAIDVVSG